MAYEKTVAMLRVSLQGRNCVVVQSRLRCCLATVTLGGFVAITLVGCHRLDPTQSALQMTPNVLDIGNIAATGQSVVTKLIIENVGTKTEEIEIKPACGCIVSDDLRFSLSKGEERKLTFTLSSYGRSGDFYSQIAILSSGVETLVPIKAVFVPQLFAIPSRVLLLSGGACLSGETSIEAPIALWPELELDVNDGEVTITEIETVSSKRRYRVSTKQLLKNYSPLVLKKTGQDSPVLTIPVVRGAP